MRCETRTCRFRSPRPTSSPRSSSPPNVCTLSPSIRNAQTTLPLSWQARSFGSRSVCSTNATLTPRVPYGPKRERAVRTVADDRAHQEIFANAQDEHENARERGLAEKSEAPHERHHRHRTAEESVVAQLLECFGVGARLARLRSAIRPPTRFSSSCKTRVDRCQAVQMRGYQARVDLHLDRSTAGVHHDGSSDRLAFAFAEASVRCHRSEPGKHLIDSVAHGWTSVLVGTVECREAVEPFEAEATPDQSLVVVTQGAMTLSVDAAGRWNAAHRTVGSVGLTPGLRRSRIRWRSASPSFETAHIYLPTALLLDASEELHRVGRSTRTEPPNALAMHDPIVSHLTLALAGGLRDGESDLFAGIVSRALAVRLLSLENGVDFTDDRRSSGALAGARLSAICTFVRENLGRHLTLDRLAAEVGYSRSHFARAFKRATGVSPHRYLLERRMEKATQLLVASDASIVEVARVCGFSSGTHLATIFRTHFGQSPGNYRRTKARS